MWQDLFRLWEREYAMTEVNLDVNPWLALDGSAPYVLGCDNEVFKRFPKYRDKFGGFPGPPGPFIGNPLTARVMLLSLNPGRDEAVDRDADRNPVIVNAWLDN